MVIRIYTKLIFVTHACYDQLEHDFSVKPMFKFIAKFIKIEFCGNSDYMRLIIDVLDVATSISLLFSR